MEAVLDLYAQPYDPDEPQVCVDERPVQLIREVRTPIPAVPGEHPERYDFEYKREGACNLFGFFQPLQGWRPLKVTEPRTAEDFALCMQYLVDVLFPCARVIHVVLDNLNTHTPAALYQTFPPQEAQQILNHLQFHYTPKHGSWLNMIELECSVFTRQCLDRRIPSIDQLQQEVAAWEATRNQQKATVNGQFSVTDARVKLQRLYPEASLS